MAACTMNKKVILVLQFILLIPSVIGLYEDQIGKFDWKQRFIGNAKFIRHGYIDSGNRKQFIFVATEANVLAGLYATSGQIAWRQVFQRGPGGNIDALLYNNKNLITLSGGGRILRSWDSSTGFLRWEIPTTTQAAMQEGVSATFAEGDDGPVIAILAGDMVYVHSMKDGTQLSMQSLPNSDTVQYNWQQADGVQLHNVGIVDQSHISVASYHTTDETVSGPRALPAAWATPDTSCAIVACNQIVCVDQLTNSLQLAPVQGANTFSATPIMNLGVTNSPHAQVSALYPARCESSEFILKLTSSHHVLLKVSGGQIHVVKDLEGMSKFRVHPQVDFKSPCSARSERRTDSCCKDLEGVHAVAATIHGDKSVMGIASFTSDKNMQLSCFIDGIKSDQMTQDVEITGSHGQPELMNLMVYEKKGHQLAFRVLLQTADHALMLLSDNHMTWHREEALPGAIAVEMVDLPVSETEAKFEDEFGAEPEESIGTMFLRRLSTQFAQLQSFVAHVQRRIQGGHHGHAHHEHATPNNNPDEDDEDEDDEYYLTRDDFNLHKILLVVTKASKIYGLDSRNGDIVWSYYLADLKPFLVGGQPKLLLFVQRTTAHFPHPPQCTVIGKDKKTGNGLLYSFNPITGKPSHEDSPYGTVLPYQIKQATMLSFTDEDFLKVVLLMDKDNKVHPYPSNAASAVSGHTQSIFLFTADTVKGTLEGFKLGELDEGTDGGFEGEMVWNIQLQSSTQNITKIVSKRQTEHVHSQGRVLGDRSVLYKYLNPNLVAIVTEGEDAGAKAHLQVYLVDVVTGNILFNTDHKRASGPVHLVHAENWIVYHYWNTRHRRYEMTVLELYEGKNQKNSTAFSSLDPPNSPIVERQSYIISTALQAMEPTYTERGITHRHILMVLSSGGILSLPKRMLDPRRPLVPTSEHKEEGLIPYLPELGIPHQSLANYNQSLSGIEGIHTAPAGLESTCLVLAYGLDYYFTRVTPSKLFDVLKEDFDYMFIAAVLTGLVVASYVTRRLASMRALKQLWK